MKASQLQHALQNVAQPSRVADYQRFFKTAPGQYGEGDVFIGVTMPLLRQVCKPYSLLPLNEVQILLQSSIHEHRMAALVILTHAYKKADAMQQQRIYDLYLNNLAKGNINNWDLIDLSAPNIIGAHLLKSSPQPLYELAHSKQLWQKRVAMLSTFAFINIGDPLPTIKIATILLYDKHDLIHKAVGWLLREMGKRIDVKLLTDFLDEHAAHMPRTMLRYAIEKLSPQKRSYYMAQKAQSMVLSSSL